MTKVLMSDSMLLMRHMRPKEKIMAKNGTAAYVKELPECDIHSIEEGVEGVPATHDVRTQDGRWANVCDEHRRTHALYPDKLGLGMGQRLIVRET